MQKVELYNWDSGRGDPGIFDIRDGGAHSITEPGFSTFDSTAAIQATVNAWMAAGYGRLKSPPGKFIFSDSIIFETAIRDNSYPMIFDGEGSTWLCNATGVPGLWFRGPDATMTWWAGMVFRGLEVKWSSGTPTHVVLFDDSDAHVMQMYQFSLENIRIVDFPLASHGLTLINKFEYQMLNTYVRQLHWSSGTAPAGNGVNIIHDGAAGSGEQCCQIYCNNLNMAFGFHCLYLEEVGSAEFVGSTFSGAYAQGVRGIASNNIKFGQTHIEGGWRGHEDYAPPGTNSGGYHKASMYFYGGSYEIDVTDVENLNGYLGAEAGEYSVEGFFTGSTNLISHMAGSGHDGRVLSLYDYGTPDIKITTLGIKSDDITFQDGTIGAKTTVL
jgi:hypothetical protein